MRLRWWVARNPDELKPVMDTKWIQLDYNSTAQNFRTHPADYPIALLHGRSFIIRTSPFCQPNYATTLAQKMRQLLRRIHGQPLENSGKLAMHGKLMLAMATIALPVFHLFLIHRTRAESLPLICAIIAVLLMK